MLTTPCKGVTVECSLIRSGSTSRTLSLSASETIRCAQLIVLTHLFGFVEPNRCYCRLHILTSLIPGRQGWRYPEVLCWRGQEFEVLWRVPGVCQDQRDRRVRRRRRRWHWVRWCRLWRLWWWLRRWYWWNLIHPVKMRSIWFGWLPGPANEHSNASQ